MEQIIKKRRFLANIIGFFGLLSYGYYFFFYIFQNYSNKIGFELHFNAVKMVEALLIVILVGLFYVINDINESVYLTYTFIFYMFIIIPSASYYFLSNNSRAYFYMQIIAICILNAMYLINQRFLSSRRTVSYASTKSSGGKLAMKFFVGFIVLFMLTDVVLFLKYGHSLLYLLHMDKVYNIRIAARAQVPSKFSYIISWSAMVIVPACIGWFVKIKKYYLIVIPAFVQILIFTIGGTKSHIFTLFLVAVVFTLFSLKKMEWFLPCLNFLLGFTLITKKAFIMAVVIRRAFFFPQSISYSYYDFFNKYPQLHLSGSILKHFFHNYYKLDAPFIISRYSYKAPVMSANTNFIANAYANFGFAGIVLFILVLGIILIVIERICYNKFDKKYIIFLTFCSFFALVNSALFTTILTHGLLLSVFMALLFFYGKSSRE